MSETKSWSPGLALALLTGLVCLVPWLFKLASAPGIGEPCGRAFDCAALDGRCVQGETGRYCTVTCERDEDCPSASHCGVPPHDLARQEFSASALSEQSCVPGPRSTQRVQDNSSTSSR